MKKVFIISILALGIPLLSFSQTKNKKNMEIGASSKAGIGYYPKAKMWQLNLNPSFGYYIHDNLILGTGLNFNFYSSESSSLSELNLGPYIKYYFSWKENLQPYVKYQVGSGLQRSAYGYKYNNEKRNSHTDYNIFWSAGIGLSYWVGPSVAITTEINYSDINFIDNRDNKSFNLNFGILIKLNRNK